MGRPNVGRPSQRVNGFIDGHRHGANNVPAAIEAVGCWGKTADRLRGLG
jgi:hypothetical protein